MKKLWGIRHIRAAWLVWRIHRHYRAWMEIGWLPVHLESDLDHARDIWKGKA